MTPYGAHIPQEKEEDMHRKFMVSSFVIVALLAPCFAGCGLLARPAPAVTVTAEQPPPIAAAPLAPEGGGKTAAKGGSGNDGTAPVESETSPPTTVIAETTYDATGEKTIGGGIQGTLTVTVRSVEVRGQTLTLRWALRWDDDKSAGNAALTQNDLKILAANATITDSVGLVLYRPFCTDGDWHPRGDGVSIYDLEPVELCQRTALVSLPAEYLEYFVNHHRVELSAIFPAPQGHPETVDVLVASGVPVFPGVRVTYR